MLNFTDNLKIYLFKDQNRVSFSVKVSDNCVHEYSFTVDEFEELINNWDQPNGVNKKYSGRHWSVNHKRSTPRPESAPASYVRLSVYTDNLAIHHRVDYTDMLAIRKDFFYQKNNVMYWDQQ